MVGELNRSVMWRIMVFLVLLVIVPCVGNTADDSFSRVGFSIGGIHIVGLYFERYFGETSIRTQVGYMLNAVSVQVSAVRYIGDSLHRPYVGIGFLKHVTGKSFQGANLLCFPVGIDFDVSHNQFLGIELIPAVSCSTIKPDGSENKNFLEYMFPLPCLYYKYRIR